MYQIEINHERCDSCKDCEKFLPGLNELSQKGPILLSEANLNKNGAKILKAQALCKWRAIMVRKHEPKKEAK